MPRFNIALLPKNNVWQEYFANLAHKYLTEKSDGYLLGDGALAHVTLCQFEAAGVEIARSAFATLPDQKSQDIIFENFILRDGAHEHAGFFWAEFVARRATNLMTQQEAVHDHLIALGLTVYTPKADYTPHLTLARLTDRIELSHLASSLSEEKIAMRPVLGHSTPNGVMTREIS